MDPTLATTRGGPTPPRLVRLTTALDVGRRAVGIPILLLAAAGAWRIATTRRREPLGLALAGWGGAAALFVAISIVQPVEPRFYRYVVEFIGRVHFATWPAVVALAGLGVTRTGTAGVAGRTAAGLLLAWAFWIGASSWWSWIR